MTALTRTIGVSIAGTALAVVAFAGALLTPVPAQAASLTAEVSADPSSGSAPLRNVDLKASVSGSAEGDITYEFDCTGDGSIERRITTSREEVTASDLCDYPFSGNYVAKIEVERDGLAFQGATAIRVTGGGELSVDVSADPNSGSEPLNDVDLTANILSSTENGSTRFRFDCTNDGDFERSVRRSSNSYTANDLCDYNAPGQYVAKVVVEKGELSFSGQTGINVTQETEEPETGTLLVDKKARNGTDGQTTYRDSVGANPGDVLHMRIKVTASGTSFSDVTLRDELPSGMQLSGNVKVDGSNAGGTITSGIDLGDMDRSDSKVVTFNAFIQNMQLSGSRQLVNTARVTANEDSATDRLTAVVRPDGTPTDVPTGPMGMSTAAFATTLALILFGSYVYFARFYFSNHLLPIARKSKAQRDLERARERALERHS